MRFIIVLLLLTSLSACKYTSDANLHGGKKFYTPSGFFATGTHYFVADDGSEYLKLVVSSTTAHVSSLEVSGTTPYSATLTGGFAPEQSGANFYIAVETESSGYSYYPFKFTRDPKWISWAKPSASTEVTSLSDLVTKAKAQFSSGLDTDFRPTTAQQWNKAVEDARARGAAQTSRNNSTSNSATTYRAPAPSGINRLDIGDVVFVQGFFSDEGVQIIRIDQGSGQVKVRRLEDGTTTWVHHSKLISREQKNVNNIGRGAAGVAIAICIFSPETCKDDR